MISTGVLWGTGGLLGQLLSTASGMNSILVATCRLLFGGLLVAAFMAVRSQRPHFTAPLVRRVALLGVLAALYQGGYFGAVLTADVSLATLITVGAAPVFVLVAEWLLGWRQVDAGSVLVVILALIALGLLVGLPHPGMTSSTVALGALQALAASAAFAAITCLSTRSIPGLDGVATTACSFTLGGLLLGAVALVTGSPHLEHPSESLLLIVALAVFPTGLAYTLYFTGLPRVQPSMAVVVTLLEPLTSTILAFVVLHERLSAGGLIGAGLLLVTIAVAARKLITVDTAMSPGAAPK